jgi:hypothetical protein
MVNDVYVFGDSHWRVFFPFVNHGAATDNVSHTQDGVRTIDTIANELSGATMYGLLNPSSKNGARNRILNTLDSLGGVDNVGLVFGEVDARYHHMRYYVDGERISRGRLYEVVARYKRFIDEDLLYTKRVRKNIFVYHGFSYPKKGETLLQPGQPIGRDGFERADYVNSEMGCAIQRLIPSYNVHCLVRDNLPDHYVSDDGVHLVPEFIYPSVLNLMRSVFDEEAVRAGREITF